MISISLPQGAWYGDVPIMIHFPDSWQVEIHGVAADDVKPLRPQRLQGFFDQPTAGPRLRDLARHKKQAVIVFDDLTRPTKMADLIPILLQELEAGGMGPEQIRFVCALGAHGAHTRADFVKKLGSLILERYPVYNHNPYENCVVIGKTSVGNEIAINTEVMRCDLKIGIGCILPHPFNGFGGGGKILLPGVANIDSIQANHVVSIMGMLEQGLTPVGNLGRFEGNPMAQEIEEVTRLAGLDFIVNALVNSRREMVDLVTGDAVEAHHEGVKRATQLYAIAPVRDLDVAIANAHSKSSEAVIALLLASQTVKPQGGDVVLVCHTPVGQVTHYLLGPFGKGFGGRLWRGQTPLPDNLDRVIAFSPFPDYTSSEWLGPPGQVHWAKTWEEVLGLLQDRHGEKARVGVFTDATMQFMAKD